MDKRTARKHALDIAVSLLEKEINSPTELTCVGDHKSDEKVRDALRNIANELALKLARYCDV